MDSAHPTIDMIMEPIETQLASIPFNLLKILITCAHDFEDDDKLNDIYSSLGITRRQLIRLINADLRRRRELSL